MKINFLQGILPLFLLAAVSCHRMEVDPEKKEPGQEQALKIAATISEGFESGTKTAYTTADVTLSTGI